ncbi:unnamed protein product [Leptidea sinapis]|uniref:Uncharacterized protein n=1 Tax=Leptidea sinapis TaxID=189913 RepID=A0A5E4QMZ0_9NEOP|nr:unnamed protein product [Leptidea sinapis]
MPRKTKLARSRAKKAHKMNEVLKLRKIHTVEECGVAHENTTNKISDAPMSDDNAEYEVIIKSEVDSDDEGHREPTSQLPQVTQYSTSALNVQPSTSTMNNTAMTEGNTKSGVIIKREPDFDSEYSGNIDIVHTDVRINSLQEQSKCNLSGLYEDSKTLIWAKKLARMTPQQRLLAEKAIDQVLNEAELGNLREGSVRIN